MVIVDEAHPRCNMATDISALVTSNLWGKLKAAPQLVTAPHAPVPFSPALEDLYIPSPGQDRGGGPCGGGEGPLMAEIQPIVMPKWGLAMQEGMLAAWHVAEGQEVTKGQEIADIETSKIANAFESPVAGPLRRRLVGEGETVPVGALLAVVADASIADDAIEAFVADFQASFAASAAEAAADTGPSPSSSRPAAGGCAT